MNAVALVLGYLLLILAGALAFGVLFAVLENRRDRRQELDRVIQGLTEEGAWILYFERQDRERAT